MEPEVHFVRDREVCVADLGGWRRARLPELPRDQRFEVVPDWVCEVLSPSTESKDRHIKLPIYARHGVPFVWLVDPLKHTLEALALREGDWEALGTWRGDETVAARPFEAIAFDLAALWS